MSQTVSCSQRCCCPAGHLTASAGLQRHCTHLKQRHSTHDSCAPPHLAWFALPWPPSSAPGCEEVQQQQVQPRQRCQRLVLEQPCKAGCVGQRLCCRHHLPDKLKAACLPGLPGQHCICDAEGKRHQRAVQNGARLRNTRKGEGSNKPRRGKLQDRVSKHCRSNGHLLWVVRFCTACCAAASKHVVAAP